MKAPNASKRYPPRKQRPGPQELFSLFGTALLILSALTTPTPALAANSRAELATDVTSIVDPSTEGLVNALTKAAASGSADAALALGNRYFRGAGVTRDQSIAVEWWQRGAELDSAEAAYNLGVARINGFGTPKDLLAAQAYFEQAATQNFPKAHLALGIIALHLAANDHDVQIAGKHFRRAAELGNETARHNLALMYETGLGYEVDEEQAAYWRATTAEESPAQAQIDHEIQTQDWVIEQNPSHFTLQLVSGDSLDATKEMIDESLELRRAVFSKMLANREHFVAIAGTFENYADATQALDELPASLKKNQPFIVTFGVLQRQINEHTKFNN